MKTTEILHAHIDKVSIFKDKENGNEKREEDEPFSILKLFFNGCYCIFFVPFRLHWDGSKGKFLLKSSKVQNVICGCSHVVLLYGYVHSIVTVDVQYAYQPNVSAVSISKLFYLMAHISANLLHALYIKSLWFDKEGIFAIVNTLIFKNLTSKRLHWVNVSSKTAAVLLFLVSIFINCASFPRYASRLSVIMNKDNTNVTSGILFEEKTWTMFNTFFYAFIFYTLIFIFTHHLFIFLVVASLVGLAVKFRHNLLIDCKGNVGKGLEECHRLRERVRVFNRVWGGKILTFSCFIVSHYGELPDIILGHNQDDHWIVTVFYVIMNNLVWITAAQFHASVHGSILEWCETCMYHGNNIALPTLPSNSWSSKWQNTYARGADHYSAEFEGYMTTQKWVILMGIKQEQQMDPIAVSSHIQALELIGGYFGQVPYPTLNFFFKFQFKKMFGLIVTYGIIVFQTRTT